MKIVNSSSKIFEWTWNSVIYSLRPGQTGDFDEPIALQALKRGTSHDESGIPIEHKIELLADLKSSDRERFDKEIEKYPCPYQATDGCTARPFKTEPELRAHLETHWKSTLPLPEEDEFAMTAPAAASGSKKQK